MKRPCIKASQTSIIKMKELTVCRTGRHSIPLKTFNFNWMKHSLYFLLIGFVCFSCKKENIQTNTDFSPEKDFSPQINFEISEQIFEDKEISCIDFDLEGNAWIGSGSELINYNNTKTKTFPVGSEIRDISVGNNGKVWIGTRDKGLACFENNKFTYYTVENAGLPRDLIIDVEAAPDGSVWFSSSAHRLGGLMHFDGQNFDLYTPENSILNQNLILGLKIDNKGNVFCHSEGTVTQAKVFRIGNNNKWNKLGGEIVFYWIGSMDVNSQSEPVVVTDHSLSSCAGCYTDEVIIYRKGKWEVIDTEFEIWAFNRMFIDKRDYIWVPGSIVNGYSGYFVYDGKEWKHAEVNELEDAFVKMAKADPNNNIWICTNNGIFIINQ